MSNPIITFATMKIKAILFLSVLLLFNWRFIFAQEALVILQPMTLEACIDYALNNNVAIKQAELNTELSNIDLVQSKTNLLPSINANASHSYNYGRTIDRFTNQFASQKVLSQNLSLSSDITLFGGLQTINAIQQNQFVYLASKYDVDKIKNDISLNVASSYLQILFDIENVESALNQLEITSAQVERTKKNVELGAAAKGALLDIQAQFALEELNHTNAQNSLDISYLSLAQLLNLKLTKSFNIVKPDLAIVHESMLTADVDQIYNTAINNLPEIKSAELKVKSSEKAIDIALGGFSPRLLFSAAYGTGYSGLSKKIVGFPTFQGYAADGSFTSIGDTVFSPVFSNPLTEKNSFVDQYRDNVNKSFGFFLTVPIFNRFQTKLNVDKARIQKLNAELNVKSTKLQLEKIIQQSFVDVICGLKKYNATLKKVAAMKESFKYIEQKFNLGMLNTNEYNDSKNKLAKSESDLLQAKYECVFKSKVLDFYLGKPLKL